MSEKRIAFAFSLSEEETEVLLDLLQEQIERVLADAKNHDPTYDDDREWLMKHAAMIAHMRATISTSSRYES